MSLAELAPPPGPKAPPHSIEAEQAVIGAVLLAPEAWWDVVDVIQARDFYAVQHRVAWEAIRALVDRDQPVDLLTLRVELQRTQSDGRGVDLAYLAELVEATPGVSNARAWAEIVRNTAQLRAVISTATRMADGAFAGQTGIPEAQAMVMALDADRGAQDTVDAPTALARFVEALDRRRNGDLGGLPTGIEVLDRRWGGLFPGQLVVIAGRPGMGKSALAMQIAHELAAREDAQGSVLIWSGEMPAEQITQREASRRGRIDFERLRKGDLSEDEWPRLVAAMSEYKRLAVEYSENMGETVDGLAAKARRMGARGQLRAVVVDYLQLLDQGGDPEHSVERLGHISRTLKRMAGELSVPVLALAQLNRSLESRANRRPTMADIRGSGAIEQDADVILGLYRDEVYNEQSQERGVAELITLKGRDVQIGTDRVEAHLDQMSFRALADGWGPRPRTLPPEDDDL